MRVDDAGLVVWVFESWGGVAGGAHVHEDSGSCAVVGVGEPGDGSDDAAVGELEVAGAEDFVSGFGAGFGEVLLDVDAVEDGWVLGGGLSMDFTDLFCGRLEGWDVSVRTIALIMLLVHKTTTLGR